MSDLVNVPCGTCQKCCKNEAIVLTDEDSPLQYGIDNLQLASGPRGDEELVILKQRPNGDCILLGEKGCTVWPNHPAMCKKYDCRVRYMELMAMTRQGRKIWAKSSVTSTADSKKYLKELLDVGREMLDKHPIETVALSAATVKMITEDAR